MATNNTQKRRLDGLPRGGATWGSRRAHGGGRIPASLAVTRAVAAVHAGAPPKAAAFQNEVAIESVYRRIAEAYDPATRAAFYEHMRQVRQAKRDRRLERMREEELRFVESDVDRLAADIEAAECAATEQLLEREIFRCLSGRTQDHITATSLGDLKPKRDVREIPATHEPPRIRGERSDKPIRLGKARKRKPRQRSALGIRQQRQAATVWLDQYTDPNVKITGRPPSDATCMAIFMIVNGETLERAAIATGCQAGTLRRALRRVIGLGIDRA